MQVFEGSKLEVYILNLSDDQPMRIASLSPTWTLCSWQGPIRKSDNILQSCCYTHIILMLLSGLVRAVQFIRTMKIHKLHIYPRKTMTDILPHLNEPPWPFCFPQAMLVIDWAVST
jgi:hypothetical protein